MAATVRTWLVVTALACGLLLLLRAADAQEAATKAPSKPAGAATKAPSTPTGATPETKMPKCEPGAAKPGRVGAVHDPENQEEEGLFNVKVKAPTGAGDNDSDDDYSDPDEPHQDGREDELVVVGH